jgi:hypothetical protein
MMETVVLVAIVVLAVVFGASLIALVVLCVHRFRHRDTMFKQLNDSRPDLNLIRENGLNNMELDDVQIHPEIDKILSNAQWVDDATGLIPHCLSILKSCHHLTERLVGATMSLLPRYHEEDQQKKLWEIIRVAQAISPRVDDVVQSMYPPLDPRLLEARCTSLVLSVTQLSLVIKFLCHIKSSWIEESIEELNTQIRVLRDAGHAVLNSCAFTGGIVNGACVVTDIDPENSNPAVKTAVGVVPAGSPPPAASSSMSFGEATGTSS